MLGELKFLSDAFVLCISVAEDQVIGRSRGGLNLKIHPLVDALGTPSAFLLTPGQRHALAGADALLPRMTADLLIADSAFDVEKRVLQPAAAANKSAVIHPAKPPPLDRERYKARHLTENFFCRQKQFRAIATRYHKTAANFLAAIHLAAIHLTATTIWLN